MYFNQVLSLLECCSIRDVNNSDNLGVIYVIRDFTGLMHIVVPLGEDKMRLGENDGEDMAAVFLVVE